MFNSKLKKENRRLRELLAETQKQAEEYRTEMLRFYNRQKDLVPITVTYTLTESDYVNYHKESARRKVARQRMAMALASKITKTFDVEEVIEDGVLVGYKYEIEAQKKGE